MKPLPKKLSEISKLKVSPGVRPGTKAFAINNLGSYGGSLNHRKYKRPFNFDQSVHLILRSRFLNGNRSLLRGSKKSDTEKILKIKAKKYGAKLFKWSFRSNHLHILIQFKDRESQSNFLRDFSGSLALYIKKVFCIPKSKTVWDGRPFSMLVKNFPAVRKYISSLKNENFGFWPYDEKPLINCIRFLLRINSQPQAG